MPSVRKIHAASTPRRTRRPQDAENFEVQWFKGMRILDYIDKRKFGNDMRIHQYGEAQADAADHRQRGGPGNRHQLRVAGPRTPERHERLDHGESQGEDERVM